MDITLRGVPLEHANQAIDCIRSWVKDQPDAGNGFANGCAYFEILSNGDMGKALVYVYKSKNGYFAKWIGDEE